MTTIHTNTDITEKLGIQFYENGEVFQDF